MGNDDVAGPKANTSSGPTSEAAEAPRVGEEEEEEGGRGEFAATATQEVGLTDLSEAGCFATVFATSGAVELE